ncbi:MAG: TolC family protein [Candidatus Acidiferrales bacterium]
MKTPSRRPLLASILAAVLAGSPVTTAFAQEPASPPAPHNVAQGAVPISLGVTKHDYTHAPKPFPNLFAPYTSQYVDPGVLTNSPRLEQLIHDGKLSLSLQDAIALALENSMDIVVTRYNPWIADVSLLKTRAGGYSYGTPGSISVGSTANLPVLYYDPLITQTISFADATTPINNPFISGVGSTGTTSSALFGLVSHSATYNTQFQKNFDWGTNLSVAWNNTRSSSNAANFFNPYVQSSLALTISQPLLAGAGRFINRRNIIIAENNRKIADLAFAQQAITTTTNTITAYWELAFARQNVNVQQQAVTVAEKLYSDNKKQLDIGTMAPLDVTRAESELATDRQNLIVAQTVQLQDELVLKNYISKDPLVSNLISVEIIPTDKPDSPAAISTTSFDDAVKEAFAKRPDLQEQYYNLKNADVDVRATKNALLPTATLSAYYASAGLAGNSFITGTPSVIAGAQIVNAAGQPVAGDYVPQTVTPITGTAKDGLSTAQSQIFHNDFPTYAAQLTLTLPLRNRMAQADNVHAQLVRRQMEAQTQQIKNNALLDVRNTTIAVEQGRAQVQAASKARELQQQTFDAERKKYELGASTVYQVILTQRDLITAQGTELRALANLAEAKANYERALGRTLEVNSVTIAGVEKGVIERDTLIPGTLNGQVVGTDQLFRSLDQSNAHGQR